MEIIRFPGKYIRPVAEPTSEYKMVVGPSKFTCDCGSVTELHLIGAIFRYIDFYCSSCGSHYKVTNPAFTRQIPKKPPPR